MTLFGKTLSVKSEAQGVQAWRAPAFTLIELLVVIAIIGILAGMLLPVLSSAKDKGQSAGCKNNLRQMVVATILYEEDHQVFPLGWINTSTPNWEYQLQPYLGRKDTNWAGNTPGVFRCPKGTGYFGDYLTYSLNYSLNIVSGGRQTCNMKYIKDPANTILFAETDGWDSLLYPDHPLGPNGAPVSSRANVLYRHSGGTETSFYFTEASTGLNKNPKKGRANAVFLDSHVEAIRNAPTNRFTLARD